MIDVRALIDFFTIGVVNVGYAVHTIFDLSLKESHA